jgi:parallel beta-helix repeat protein
MKSFLASLRSIDRHLDRKTNIDKFVIRSLLKQGLGGLTLVAASMSLLANPARSEGSFQMGLNQRLYEYGFSLLPLIPPRDRSLFVDIKTIGEVINVSLCGSGGAADPLKIEIYNPAGSLVFTQNIAANANSPGRVSCTDTFAAVLTNPSKYVTTTTGAYSVRLYNQRTAADAPNDQTGSLIRRFDVTVTPDSATSPNPTANGGRLYAKSWALRADTNDFLAAGGTSGDYYVKVPGGAANTNYVWKLDLNQFAGLTYEINANNKGVNAPSNGFSTPLSGNSLTELYPVYASYPAVVFPEPAVSPNITNISFVDSAGVDNTISPGTTIGIQDTGTFKFTSDVPGNYSIVIDTNQDGKFTAGDVYLFGNAVAGVNSVIWNGKDVKGNVLPVGSYNTQIQVRVGEYHFVSGDAETSGGGTNNGLTIYRASYPSGVLAPTSVFWDDLTKLPGAGGTSNLPTGGASGTVAGTHTWGNFTATAFGDQKFIDTYTYGNSGSVTTFAIIATTDTVKYSISGKVYNDANYNGVNNSETSISGTKISLFATNASGVATGTAISTQTTDASGNYVFPPVAPGTYIVQEVDASGWISTTSNARKVIVTTANQINQDFGDYQQTDALCPSTAFLQFYPNGTTSFDGTKLYTLDLASGATTVVPGSSGISSLTDVLAFNKLDGFLYAVDDNKVLYRISQSGVAVSLGVIPGASTAYPNGGDIDANGYLYMTNFNSTVIDVVDLNSARSTFGTQVGSFTVSNLPLLFDGDIGVNPIDSKLYIVGKATANTAYKITPPATLTGSVTATTYSISGTGANSSSPYYGSTFMTATGRAYNYIFGNSGASGFAKVVSHNPQSSPSFVASTNQTSPFLTNLVTIPASDGAACAFAPTPPVPSTISGTVFEDVNYGGGAGRNVSTPGAIGLNSVTVELYTNTGIYAQTTTTDINGKYNFSVAAGSYQVRVVNNTVKSSRVGGLTTGLIPVQTYRVDVAAGAVTANLNQVGGEDPKKFDAGVRTTETILAQVETTTPNSKIESIAQVTGISGTVGASNVDFGFNFDTIVNTNDSGQGSLRQFILNSNKLSNAGLSQVGQLSGTEASIFMISDGSGRPGLTTGIATMLTAGVAQIAVTSVLPAITDSYTLIDGGTQTTNINNTNSGSLGAGIGVGLNGNTLAQVSKPEVEIKPIGSIATGLSILANNTTITNIAIEGFGTSASNGSLDGNISVGGTAAVSDTNITQNIIGTAATAFSDLGASRGLGSGIVLVGTGTIDNTLIKNNLIGYNAFGGIVSAGTTTGILTDLTISGNEIANNGQSGTNTDLAGIDLSRASIGAWANVSIEKNLIANNVEQGIQLSHATNVTMQDNTISGNGTGGSGVDRDGILVGASTNSTIFSNQIVNNKAAGAAVLTEGGVNATGIKISQNEFGGNTNNAIDLGRNGVSTNTNNCTAVNSGGANGNLARPVITSTGIGTGTMILSGTTCNIGTYDLEFYKAGATGTASGSTNDDYGPDSKPAGEGRLYLGKLTGVTGGTFTDQVVTLLAPLDPTDKITSIAINTSATGTNNTSEFSENVGFTPAKVLFVERITAVNGAPITTIEDDLLSPHSADDNDPKWPTGYLQGAINKEVKPGDIVEYTVYFLNTGGSNADDVRICNVLQPKHTFLTGGTNTHDLEMLIGGSSTVHTFSQAKDTDRGEVVAADLPLPSSCNFLLENTNGTTIIDVTGTTTPSLPTLLNAKTPGMANSYGLIRFTTKIDP